MKDTFTVLKKAVAKQKYIAFYFFEFLREQVPEFYVKRTDPNKRTYPISTCIFILSCECARCAYLLSVNLCTLASQ